MSDRKFLFKALSLVFLTGCLSDNGLGSAAMAQDNVWNLSRLSIGMSESQVLHIMSHPYKKQSFESQGDVYHIWFYVTRPVGLDQSRLVKQNLTPLTFENGVLLGWGFDFYQHIERKVEQENRPEKPQAKPQHMQDKPLEKVIEGIQESPNPQATSENEKKPKKPKKTKKTKSSDQKEEKQEESKDRLNDEDRQMIEDENEQNFNFW